MDIPDFKTLKEKQRRLRGGFPDDLSLRVHRAISWLGRAEQEKKDLDVRFVLLWMGFNAAYARIPRPYIVGKPSISTQKEYQIYFDSLVSLDKENRIVNAVWKRFSREVRDLLSNKYVFAPFWHYHHGSRIHKNWRKRLDDSWNDLANATKKQETDTPKILSIVFERLYVLRNQLIHGGTTQGSSYAEEQVHDGAAIMGWMLPIFIDLMLDNHAEDWGPPYYPRVEGKPLLPLPIPADK